MVLSFTCGCFNTGGFDIFCLLLYLWPAKAVISEHREPESPHCHEIFGSGGAVVHVNIPAAAAAGSGCCELPLGA